MKTITKSLLLAVMMTLAAGAVFAQSVSDAFEVRANVPDRCRISALAADLDFVTYDPWDTPSTGTTSLGVQCIRGTTANISWVGSNDGDVLPSVHAMASGTERLGYDLEFSYDTDPPLSNGASIDSLFSTTSAGKTINIAGTVPIGQDVSVGNYTDTVTVTISF